MFEIYIDGRNYPKDGVGFAVIMKYGQHIWKRTIKCDKITANQSELKALLYCLQSIKPSFKGKELIINTKNKYIPLMFEKDNEGKWVRDESKIELNTELIKKSRAILNEFNFTVKYNPNEPTFVDTCKMVESTIKTKQEIFLKK